jgi:hypothetical protein
MTEDVFVPGEQSGYLEYMDQLFFGHHVVIKQILKELVITLEDRLEDGRIQKCIFHGYAIII